VFKLNNYYRLLIAVMHFNENFGREQAVTKAGKERIKFYYPKAKQGECTPKIVPVQPTYSKSHKCMLKSNNKICFRLRSRTNDKSLVLCQKLG